MGQRPFRFGVINEQVFPREAWVAHVRRVEAEGYASGATVLPACGVGAPHVRNRLWWTAVADTNCEGLEGIHETGRREHLQSTAQDVRRHWLSEPAMDRVAYGIPNRVGRLRAYGNAIVPQVAAEFIRAFCEIDGAENVQEGRRDAS